MPHYEDPQKRKLYAAESEVRVQFLKQDTLGSVQNFVVMHRKVTQSDWWRTEIGCKSTVEVSSRMQVRASTRGGSIIVVGSHPRASWSWCQMVLAHELAHVAHAPHVRAYEPGHSPNFAGWQLAVTEAVIGKAVADRLRVAFTRHGVQWATQSIAMPDAPIIGYRELVTTGPDPEFAARRAEANRRARENRRGNVEVSRLFA